ncbi:hypothetical protein GSY74_02740 [Sulfurovum sp. bin170]|uniref:hypothetical protein n=1 Tax=Sulfurovum sp. bin170 TaxID=2695268 RepID=UPI0013E05FA6|nr:hypothetical protein [Sulfurovum sp. bin170]NEW60189.1 hypothetical protein [Sulfurovum sp. bin170]
MRNYQTYLLLIVTFFTLFTSPIFASDIEYSYVPKKVYEKQVFPISFLSTSSQKERITFQFADREPVIKDAVIIKNGAKTFYTFYFKTTERLFQIPSITITLKGKKIELDGVKIPVESLGKRENFSGVIASGLKIKSYQASVYDERTNLITISIEAHDANLEDIYVSDAIKDGVEKIKRTGSKIEGDYHIVLPSEQSKLTFSYFDTMKDKFIDKKIPISIDDGSVAAQTDLNPKDDSFEILKKYTLIGLITILVLLFLWKRDFFYLIVAVIAAIILLTFYTPLSKVCIKAGSALYILPTPNSTISLYTDQRFSTTELGERDEYHKIEYTNGIIGWIKDEDICKN